MQRRYSTALILMLGIGLLSIVGCKTKDSPTGDRPSLLVPGELEEMRKIFTEIAAKNASKICKRPVLRPGPTVAGRADEDMLAMLDSEGAMKPCYSALVTLEESKVEGGDILEWLREVERKAQANGQQGELIKAKAAIADLQEACSILVAPLSKAVSHEDACSPYLPGRLGQGELLPFIRLSKAAVLVSRNLALNGKQLQAVQLLLDTLRFSQDLSRGGTSLIEPMIASASHGIVRSDLNMRFDELSIDELRVVEGELSLLIESQPHYSEYFDGERDSSVMLMVWPALEANGWQPPGGYAKGQTGPMAVSEEPGGLTAKETAAALWVVSRDNAKILGEKCKRSTPLRACIAAMESYGETVAKVAKPDIAKLLKMASLSEADARAEVRKQITDVLRAVSMPVYSKYHMKMETMRISLVAQHNKVQSLIAAKTNQPCPAPFASDDTDTIPRVVTPNGQVKLYQPQWIVDRATPGRVKDKTAEPIAHFRCP